MADKSKIAERLKLLRTKSKFTQEEVANKIHVSQSAYAYYELAKKEPKIDTLEKLAELYNTSIDYIVGRY